MLIFELKMFDYYFFSIGVANLVTAFFLIGVQADASYLFLLMFFYLSNFCVSLLLNLALNKKLKEIYFIETKSYIITHLFMALVTSGITSLALVFVSQTIDLISYFMSVNFFVMMVVLVRIFMKSVSNSI